MPLDSWVAIARRSRQKVNAVQLRVSGPAQDYSIGSPQKTSPADNARAQARELQLITSEQMEEQPRPVGIKHIKGTLKLLCVRFAGGSGAMSSRPLSCYCEPFRRGEEEGSLNSAWVQGWKAEDLRRGAGAAVAADEDEPIAGEDCLGGRHGCAGARLAS